MLPLYAMGTAGRPSKQREGRKGREGKASRSLSVPPHPVEASPQSFPSGNVASSVVLSCLPSEVLLFSVSNLSCLIGSHEGFPPGPEIFLAKCSKTSCVWTSRLALSLTSPPPQADSYSFTPGFLLTDRAPGSGYKCVLGPVVQSALRSQGYLYDTQVQLLLWRTIYSIIFISSIVWEAKVKGLLNK